MQKELNELQPILVQKTDATQRLLHQVSLVAAYPGSCDKLGALGSTATRATHTHARTHTHAPTRTHVYTQILLQWTSQPQAMRKCYIHIPHCVVE